MNDMQEVLRKTADNPIELDEEEIQLPEDPHNQTLSSHSWLDGTAVNGAAGVERMKKHPRRNTRAGLTLRRPIR